jgi:hypothetical protein
LQGVLDDRGKYLFLTESELESAARFFARRGRVSIHDIVAEFNKIIDLSAASRAEEEEEAEAAGAAKLVLDDDDEEDKAA